MSMATYKATAAAALSALASEPSNLGSLEGANRFLDIVIALVQHAEIHVPPGGSGTLVAGATPVTGNTSSSDQVLF